MPASVTLAENATTSVDYNLVGNTKSGYIFSFWNTAADGSGQNYSPTSIFTMGTSNVTLYAQWIASPTLTVQAATTVTATTATIRATVTSLGVPVATVR